MNGFLEIKEEWRAENFVDCDTYIGGTTSDLTDAEAQEAREKGERGEKTAANIRYGQAISEQGMGGETKGLGGVGGQQGTW